MSKAVFTTKLGKHMELLGKFERGDFEVLDAHFGLHSRLLYALLAVICLVIQPPPFDILLRFSRHPNSQKCILFRRIINQDDTVSAQCPSRIFILTTQGEEEAR
jgi:hypothetical protein